MSKITTSQVKHVALLARLGVSAAQLTKFQKQLSAILGYIDRLNELDTETVEPISQTTGLVNITREDKLGGSQGLTQKQALQNAPSQENGYVKVKKVL